jgi:hypothetical protein
MDIYATSAKNTKAPTASTMMCSMPWHLTALGRRYELLQYAGKHGNRQDSTSVKLYVRLMLYSTPIYTPCIARHVVKLITGRRLWGLE